MTLNRFEYSLIYNNKLPSTWQSQSSLDELDVFLQQNWELRRVLYNDESIYSRQQFIEFVGKKGVKTKNYVGTIMFKGEQLNIFPKVFGAEKDDFDADNIKSDLLISNLIVWLEYCVKFNYPYISITSELEDSNSLKDLFISIYVKYVHSAMSRGLFYRYEDKTEDERVIKGKINYKDYYSNKFPNGKIDIIQCTHSNYEVDNLVNRIIKYTCKVLINETTANNQRLLRDVLLVLKDVSDVKCSPYECDKIRFNRKSDYYSIIMSMSKIFLLNRMSNYNEDNSESFCFLFPMEVLYEGFLGGFIQETLGENAIVKLQESKTSLFSNVIYAEKKLGKSHTMRHDILIEHKHHGLFILDAKYKQISRFENNDRLRDYINSEVSSSDLYQVLEYARKQGVKDVYLLYPMFKGEDVEPYNPYGISDDKTGFNKINVHFIRVPFVFEENQEAFKQKIGNAISKVFNYDKCDMPDYAELEM